MQIFGVGARGKGLVLFSRLTDGSVVAVARVHRRIVGQDQELLGNAVDFLTERFWTAGFARTTRKQGVSGEQMVAYQKAG